MIHMRRDQQIRGLVRKHCCSPAWPVTGIDMVSTLNKMKAPFTGIRIEATAEQTDAHPRVFKEIHITYFVTIPAAYEDKVKRAVDLSLDKYCGVAAMLRKHCAIISKVVIE